MYKIAICPKDSNLKTLLPLEGFCYCSFFYMGLVVSKLFLKCCFRVFFPPTLLGVKFLVEAVNSCYVLATKQKKKGWFEWWPKIAESLQTTANKKPWVKPSWVHHGLSQCPGPIINLLFVHLGWMASMLSLAAWRKEWKWSRKWSLLVPGLGDPPRGSLSQTVESSSRLLVSGGHGRKSHLLL